MANPIITRIQVEGNDVVSFLNGISPNFTYVRSMSQILPQNPTYISYRYDSITISQVGGDAFTFTVYTVEQVGGVSFTTLNFNDPADVVQAKTIEIYRLLVTAIFKGCCECGDTIPDCSIQYKYDEDPALLGTFKYTGSTIAFNYTTGNNQDFTGFFPIIQDGSWVFIFSKTDPTVYTVLQLSNFTDAGTHAQFDAIELNAQGTPFVVGTDFCIDFTSVGGSLVQGWQDTLDINSTLDKDNTVDGAGFDFVFDNNNSFTINSPAGSIEATPSGVSLNSGSQQVLVTPGYIDIVTPGIGSASTGWVLALTSTGHVEYVEAGTGTISSIGLFMPPAFTVSTPNPLTSDGSFTVTGAGSALEYIDGTGNLQTFPIYTVENGLHTKESPANPNVFHLGGVLIENTTITTTNGANEYALGVLGTANQDTQQPFGVANLGNGGVATFQDYGSGTRTNPSVEIVGDVDLVQPLLQLTMEGTLPSSNNTLLRLAYTGTPGLAATSVDFQFRNNNAVAANSNFISAKITNTITNFTDNSEASDFGIQLIQGGALANKLQVKSFGQLILNDYATSQFTNSTPNIDNTLTYVLAVKSDGTVWKKFAGGGGTVTSVGATGLLTTTATNPFTVSGTVTSEMNSGFLVGRYSSGLGVFEEIAIGDGLALTGGTLSADGTVPTYTVDNGLTENPAYNFQLGGPLIQDTTITGASKTWGIDFNNLSYIYGSVGEFYVSASNPSGYTDIDLWGGGGYITHVDASGSIGNVQFLPAVVSLGFSDPIGGGTIQFTPTYSRFGYFYYSGLTSIDYNIEINPAGINVKTPKVQQNAAGNGQVLTLMDATTGRAEWQNAGPSGAYDSNQGVYKDTSGANDTFMLGAPSGSQGTIPFTINRYIDTRNKFLSIEGDGGQTVYISNNYISPPFPQPVSDPFALKVYSLSLNAIKGISDGLAGIGVQGIGGSNGAGVYGIGNSGVALYGESSGSYGLQTYTSRNYNSKFTTDYDDASPLDLIEIVRNYAGGTPTTGSGSSITTSLNNIIGTRIISVYEDATTNKIGLEFQTKNASVSESTKMILTGSGQLRLNEYGQTPANFPDASPVWALGVDSSGNVVEFTPSNGGTYDSDQGIYKDTSGANDTFMLGAPYGLGSTIKFMEERQVDIDVWTLYIDGVNPGGYVAAISNADAVDSGSALYVSSVSGNGLDASSPGGRAVNALANNAGSYAVFASNKSGIGTSTYSRDTYALEAKTQDGIPGLFQIGKPSLTASLFDIIQLRATNIDVTGGINIASQLNAIPVSNLTTKWTTYNDVSQFEIQTKPSGGSLTTHLAVKGTGQLQLNKYGQTPANFPDTPVWALGVDSSGNVVEFDSGGGGGGGGAGGRSYYLNGGTNQGTIGAITSVKQMSPIPVVGSNTDFPISSPGYVASFITDVGDPNQTVIPAGNWNFELWFSANSSGGTPNFYVELYKWDGATLTSIATSSATPEGITNGTTIDLYTTALAVPQTTLTSSDRLMVRVYVNTSGKTITFHTQDSHLCQVITTFASGIVSLNGLTGSVQTFATGTTGTDFAISSAGTIHTFNLPTASSSNTGKLSSTDWTNFNTAYTNRITSLTTTGSSGAATLSSNTLNIPNYTLSGLGGVPTSRTLTINGTALDLSADRSWTVGSVTSVSALTLGTSGTDLSSTVATGTTTPVITLNVPTASASNRGALSSADWSRFDGFKTQTININVDGSGGVITAGVKGYVRIPYACTITSWSIITNVTGGSLFFDIWRSNNAIPLVANSIVGGGTKPNIGGQITSSAPAGWTSTSLVANDVLAFNVESGATVYSWAILQLTITRS